MNWPGTKPTERCCVLFAVCLLASSCASGRGAGDLETITAVADSVAGAILAGPPRVAGLAIAVSVDGQRVLERAYGSADDAAGVPLEAAIPMQIGSLTKQFTAAAVLKLVEGVYVLMPMRV